MWSRGADDLLTREKATECNLLEQGLYRLNYSRSRRSPLLSILLCLLSHGTLESQNLARTLPILSIPFCRCRVFIVAVFCRCFWRLWANRGSYRSNALSFLEGWWFFLVVVAIGKLTLFRWRWLCRWVRREMCCDQVVAYAAAAAPDQADSFPTRRPFEGLFLRCWRAQAVHQRVLARPTIAAIKLQACTNAECVAACLPSESRVEQIGRQEATRRR